MSLRSVLGSAVISYCFRTAEISARETGSASSVVSQRYLNMMSVRFVSAMLSSKLICGILLTDVIIVIKQNLANLLLFAIIYLLGFSSFYVIYRFAFTC